MYSSTRGERQMTKAKFKTAIKQHMKKYNFTLEQAIWSAKKMQPEYVEIIALAELDLLADEMLGHL
jgi:hypothetical protein